MALSAAFFEEVVRPIADARLGPTTYAAALLGGGSEVLGLDTELSADHDWGPRVTLLVDPAAVPDAGSIEPELPREYRGVSRHFGAPAGGAPWVHPFEVSTVPAFFRAWVGFVHSSEATRVDWLSRPAMSFLAVTAGEVFHDGAGDLTKARAAAHWYPDDVWRWLVACQWQRIGEEEPFIERAALAGDAFGARLVLGRVARDAVRLAFLLDRRHAPYSKWLGAAYATLAVADRLGPALDRALSDALEVLGAVTNERLGTDVDPSRRPFFGRPIHVAPAGDFVDAILATVADDEIRSLPVHLGNVDQLYGTNSGSTPGADVVYRALLLRR